MLVYKKIESTNYNTPRIFPSPYFNLNGFTVGDLYIQILGWNFFIFISIQILGWIGTKINNSGAVIVFHV